MSKEKFKWKYGENKTQKYYDTKIGTDYLCVFCNKWQPDIWMGMINNSMIWDKTWNDRQRKKQGLPKKCDISMLATSCLLCNSDPEYIKKKVEWCYDHNLTEISR